MSAALSAGEVRRTGTTCGGRGAGGAGGARAVPGRCPAPSGRGGAGASALGQSRGLAGGAGWSRGRAGSGGPGHLLGRSVRPRGANRARPGVRAPLAGQRVALGQLPRALQPLPRASGDPLFPGPSPLGALPLCTGRSSGRNPWIRGPSGVGPAGGCNRAPTPHQRPSPGKQAATRHAWPWTSPWSLSPSVGPVVTEGWADLRV